MGRRANDSCFCVFVWLQLGVNRESLADADARTHCDVCIYDIWLVVFASEAAGFVVGSSSSLDLLPNIKGWLVVIVQFFARLREMHGFQHCADEIRCGTLLGEAVQIFCKRQGDRLADSGAPKIVNK